MREQRFIEKRAEYFTRLRDILRPINKILEESDLIANTIGSLSDEAHVLADAQPAFGLHAKDVAVSKPHSI